MAEQLDIFGNAIPFDQLGSREVRAGQRGGSVEAAKIPDDAERYVQMMRVFGATPQGMTDDELARRLPLAHPGTLSKRRLRLEQAGLVEHGNQEMRPTRYGVDAMVFRITDKGRQVLAQWER